MNAKGLIGSWKLVSWQAIVDGQPRDFFGAKPKGSLILTESGRAIVDASWNEAWNGTERRRKFRLEGNTLRIESAPAPSLHFPGKVDYHRIVWERETDNSSAA